MSRNEIPAFEDWVKGMPEVEELYGRARALRASGEDPKHLKEFLGEGRDKIVLGVGDYALKFHRRRHETPFPQTVRPLREAMGIRGVEQIVAVSHRQQIIVSDRIAGTMPAKVRAESLVRWYVNPDNTSMLRMTLEQMRERGLYIEGPKNMIVNKDGFHVIDPVDRYMHNMTVNDLAGAVGLVSDVGWNYDSNDIAMRSDNEQQTIKGAFLSAGSRI